MKISTCALIVGSLCGALLSSCSNSDGTTGQSMSSDIDSGSQNKTFQCKTDLAQYSISNAPPALPLFENSVVSTDFDFITTQDTSEFNVLQFVGRSRKEMPDKRTDVLFDDATFVFKAEFSDATIEIWLHSDFENQQSAGDYAQMLVTPLGQLPRFMRQGLRHVVVHRGNESAFGEHEGHFFVVYSENMKSRISTHDLEETVFHESVHATLDLACEQADSGWNRARANDNAFISVYAAENSELEDLAESALFAYTLIKYPGRLPESVEAWIRLNMPNRLLFFQSIY